MKTVGLSAAVAALMLAASTTYAAEIDLSNALGSSGGYSSRAYYQGMLGGQPVTTGQQAYADQEDQLRLLGFQSELRGDMALGQMFYHMAYGIAPPSPLDSPPSAMDTAGERSGLGPSSNTPSGLVDGSSSAGQTDAGSSAGQTDAGSSAGQTDAGSSAGLTNAGYGAGYTEDEGDVFIVGYDGSDLVDWSGAGLTFTGIAAPEPPAWAMMLLGFAGLGFLGWRARRASAASA